MSEPPTGPRRQGVHAMTRPPELPPLTPEERASIERMIELVFGSIGRGEIEGNAATHRLWGGVRNLLAECDALAADLRYARYGWATDRDTLRELAAEVERLRAHVARLERKLAEARAGWTATVRLLDAGVKHVEDLERELETGDGTAAIAVLDGVRRALCVPDGAVILDYAARAATAIALEDAVLNCVTSWPIAMGAGKEKNDRLREAFAASRAAREAREVPTNPCPMGDADIKQALAAGKQEAEAFERQPHAAIDKALADPTRYRGRS